MEKLKQGTRVEFNTQLIKGKGTIVGVATTDLPIIGCLYIIEPDENIQNSTYDYTHFAAYKSELKVI